MTQDAKLLALWEQWKACLCSEMRQVSTEDAEPYHDQALALGKAIAAERAEGWAGVAVQMADWRFCESLPSNAAGLAAYEAVARLTGIEGSAEACAIWNGPTMIRRYNDRSRID